jgi:hypothetical protein
MKTTFGPTVAGRFYPSDPNKLREMVQDYLAQGRSAAPASEAKTLAVVAPHAGYIYSGLVAGFSYAAIATERPKTLFVMGPSHYDFDTHACTLDVDIYRTPLGDIPIARDVVTKLLSVAPDLFLFHINPRIFEPEHSVDVQLPFIKLALPSARLVPIIVPFATQEKLDAIGKTLFDLTQNDKDTLVIASSDFSHFFPYDQAKKTDLRILDEIKHFDYKSLLAKHDERRGPCGVAPIVASLQMLNHYSGTHDVDVLSYMNSGDTQGGRDRVVGYASIALRNHPPA